MKKMWIAVLVMALCMLMMTSCGTTAVETEEPALSPTHGEELDPITETVTYDGVPVTATVSNRPELDTFVNTVSYAMPATYSNTRSVNGEDVTYTLVYEGSLDLLATVSMTCGDETEVRQMQLFLIPAINLYSDATGSYYDTVSYNMEMDSLGLTPFLETKLYQTMGGVYALGAVDEMGNAVVVDYWFNAEAAAQYEYYDLLLSMGMLG